MTQKTTNRFVWDAGDAVSYVSAFLEANNMFVPIYSEVELENVLIQKNYTKYALSQDENSDDILVPFENYGLMNGTKKLIGKFSDYNLDGKPQKYELAKFDDTFFDPIILEWNQQLQLTKREYIDFSTIYDYSPHHEMSTMTDPDGISTGYLYDQRGRLQLVSTRNNKIITEYKYNIDPGDNWTKEETRFYDGTPTQWVKSFTDGLGKPIRSERHDGTLLSSAEYDGLFRVENSYQIGKGDQFYEYDPSILGRCTKVTDAVGNLTIQEQTSKEGYPFVTRVTDPNGNVSEQLSNGIGQLKLSVAGVGTDDEADTKYYYDELTRLITIENPISELFEYSYNNIDKPYRIKIPGKNEQFIVWDNSYRPVGTVDGNGTYLLKEFDDYNRLLRTYKSTGTFGYTYDPSNPIPMPIVADGGDLVNQTLTDDDLYFETTYETGHTWIGQTRDRVLATSPAEFVQTTFTNDNYGRPTDIETILPGYTVNSILTNTDADLIGTNDISIIGNYTLNYKYTNQFDEVLRMKQQSIQIEAGPIVPIVKFGYNEHDQVASKLIGGTSQTNEFLQFMGYSYDEAAKLVAINSPASSICFETEDFCELSITIELNEEQALGCAFNSIEIDGLTIPIVNISPLDPGALQTAIIDALDDNGYYGTVQIQYNRDGGAYIYITITSTNLQTLVIHTNCGPQFNSVQGDCCVDGGVLNQSGDGSSMTKALYFQEMTYDGINISRIQIGSDCESGLFRWDYTYDPLHRLKIANHTQFQFPETYSDRYSTNYTYDDAGNIQSLNRNGVTHLNGSEPVYGQIDNLVYSYLGNSSILQSVADGIGDIPILQYEFGASSATYTYDNNGNAESTGAGGLDVSSYGINNMPLQLDKGSDGITNTYTFGGTRLKKEILENGQSDLTEYIGELEIKDGEEFLYHTEGRIQLGDIEIPNEFQYKLSDHLGNTVVMFADLNGDDILNIDPESPGYEVLQRNLYYPFGAPLEFAVDPIGTIPSMDYLYNGKELDNDLGLNWYAYGARFYDASIGRFSGVDPISDQFPHVSTYNYAENRVPNGIDLHGLQFSSSISGAAWLAERQNPETAKGLYKTARNYEVYGGLGTLAGGATWVLGGAVAEYGWKAVLSWFVKEGVEETASQLTGGLSDVLDLSKMVTKGVQKLASSLDDVKKAYDDAGFKIVQESENNTVYEVPKADGDGTFYSRLQKGSGEGDYAGDRIINTQNTGDPSNKQYVKTDGSPITGPVSKDERRRIGHIHLESPNNE